MKENKANKQARVEKYIFEELCNDYIFVFFYKFLFIFQKVRAVLANLPLSNKNNLFYVENNTVCCILIKFRIQLTISFFLF